jgi:CheY-like chemotaxis protein
MAGLLRLLIVEDNPELAALVAAAARARGYVVQVALSGADGLEAMASGPLEAALIDLNLPDLRGSELLKEAREREIHAVATSGVYRGDRFAREATEVHGAAAFFEKPFDLQRLLEAIDRAAGAGAERPELPEWAGSGPIVPGTVPRLLNAYYEASHGGELRVHQRGVIKVIDFRDGRPVAAASNQLPERFGRICVRRGAFPEAELPAVMAFAREHQLRTGEAMIRMGLLNPEQRKAMLEAQVRELIWSTFGWLEGDYSFSAQHKARSDQVPLSLFPGTLILDGVNKTETLHSLRSRMGPQRRLFPTADPPYELHELNLSGPQAHLIAYADGSKTVEDLVTLSDLSERDALAALLAFEWMGLVEERRDGGRPGRVSYGL